MFLCTGCTVDYYLETPNVVEYVGSTVQLDTCTVSVPLSLVLHQSVRSCVLMALASFALNLVTNKFSLSSTYEETGGGLEGEWAWFVAVVSAVSFIVGIYRFIPYIGYSICTRYNLRFFKLLLNFFKCSIQSDACGHRLRGLVADEPVPQDVRSLEKEFPDSN